MINIQNYWRKFVVLFAIYLIGALFFITNEKSSNILQNAPQPTSKISSTFVSNNLPELKQGIYKNALSGEDANVGVGRS